MRAKALPVLLLLAFVLGLRWPAPGREAAALALPFFSLGGWITAVIFLVSGWQLDLGSLRTRRWGPSLGLGLGLNLLAAPLLGAALLAAARATGLDPALGLGLALMASVPTTLNTGLAIAIGGGGDAAMAVLLTLSISLGAVAVLPLSLPALAGAGAGGGLEAGALFLKLLTQVLLPLLLGLALRRRWTAPAALLWLPNLGVAASVWLAISRHRGALPGAAWLAETALLFVLLRGALHAAALLLAGRLRLDAPARRSFTVVASQKSVVLASALLSQLPPSFEPLLGGAAFFCVLYHLGQAFWDSALAPKVA